MIICAMCNGECEVYYLFLFLLQQLTFWIQIIQTQMFENRSPIHPSVFATASSNGTLAFWNLATSIDEPISGLEGVTVEKISETSSSSLRGVNRLKWSADGRRIAAACSDTLYVLGISEELWKPNGDEEIRLMSNLKSRGFLDEE